MTELKRKQAEQLIKKASKNRKKATNLLMCGAILSTTVLPLTTVFASTLMDKQPTEQTESSTVDSSVEETVEDTTSVFSDTYQETVQETNDEEPDFDVVEQQSPAVEQPKEEQAPVATPRYTENDWVLMEDGYYHLGGDIRNEGTLDVTVNFVDKETGALLGSYFSPKHEVNLGMSVIADEDLGINPQEYVVEEDNQYVDYGWATYDEDGNLIGYRGVKLGYSDMPTDGKGNSTVTVQLKKYVKEEVPTPEEVSFTVSYVDENNKQISETDTYTGEEGQEYWINFPEFYGYKFAEGQAIEMQGTYEKGMANVTVHYVKDDETDPSVEMGTVTVKHVDIDTNKEIATPDTITDEVGMGYWASEKEIEGYDFVEEFDEDGSSLQGGTITTEPQTHVLHYKSNGEVTPPTQEQSGGVTINFWFALNSTMIKEPIHLDGKVGESYSYDIADIPATITYEGRTFYLNTDYLTSIADQFEGTFAKELKEINVVYDLDNGTVTPENQESSLEVLFLDQNGDPIKDSVLIEGTKGDKYDISKFATDIKGYTLDKTKLPTLTGTLDGNNQAVFYFTEVDDTTNGGNTGDNGSDNGGNTGNGDNGNNSNGGTDNNSGSNSGNTNSNDADTNNSGNGSSSNNTPINNNSNTGSSNNTNNSTNTTQTSSTEGLPQTGESSNPWLTASGIVTMASTTLAWVLKRKHG
ncbi:MucBP domain-containing protein [Vagococcus zengguangii]|uniref:LPXTG cell wall anchor domain-containing protein n=1 Tax=Vagococcus zengguangii TaxID=2571750 RepID=A0A4D7CXE8_9ENTE|nr:MucBP domain-containing protein [Vagococcus zengguangii]QCI87111.1 LPXTG cell wall anchor domain-containing protein [Vagococcus zengguangii]